jgi:hypothetical protein
MASAATVLTAANDASYGFNGPTLRAYSIFFERYRLKFEGPAEPDSNGRLPRIKAGSLSDGNLALFMEELWGDDGFSRGNFKKMGQLQSLRRRHLRVLSSTLRTSTMVSKRKKIPILLMNN